MLILTLGLCEDLVFCGEVPLVVRVFGCKTNEVLCVRLKARDLQETYKCKRFHHTFEFTKPSKQTTLFGVIYLLVGLTALCLQVSSDGFFH